MKKEDPAEISIKIPGGLMEDIKRILENYNFQSAEEFILFLILQAIEIEKNSGAGEEENFWDEEKRKRILKDLGYI